MLNISSDRAQCDLGQMNCLTPLSLTTSHKNTSANNCCSLVRIVDAEGALDCWQLTKRNWRFWDGCLNGREKASFNVSRYCWRQPWMSIDVKRTSASLCCSEFQQKWDSVPKYHTTDTFCLSNYSLVVNNLHVSVWCHFTYFSKCYNDVVPKHYFQFLHPWLPWLKLKNM